MAEEKNTPQEGNRPNRRLQEAAARTSSIRQLTARVSNTAAETAKIFGRRRTLKPSADVDLVWPE